jgi:hypothetical protein
MRPELRPVTACSATPPRLHYVKVTIQRGQPMGYCSLAPINASEITLVALVSAGTARAINSLLK